ncbi:MAG: prolyl oligopeptidase family serine peptidase [Acidobacteria bacterium]|nr:prolyl oligopeptidase family serine peptidase [Acidobacteriota bacterium]
MRNAWIRPVLAGLYLLLLLAGVGLLRAADALPTPRPLEIPDLLAWQSIRQAVVSPDGLWLAYRLVPNEGDGEVILRHTAMDTERRFPAGEGSRGELAFSRDSAWLAFTLFPTHDEAKKLKKQKKPARNAAGLVQTVDGELVKFENIRAFAFSGENPGWIALHKYPEKEAKPGAKEEDPAGADLVLQELATGKQLALGNVAEFAFDKPGRWLALCVAAADRLGNGAQLRDMATGILYPLDSGEARYEKLGWTKKGDGLAVLKGRKDKAYEEELYSVLGFTDFGLAPPVKMEYNPHADASFPAGMSISPSRTPQWTEDLTGLLFGIREIKAKEKTGEKAAPDRTGQDKKDADKKADAGNGPPRPKGANDEDEELPGLVIWHWRDKRLQSQQQVEERRDKNFSYLCVYRVADPRFIRLADDEVREVVAAPKQRWAIGENNEPYRRSASLDGRRFRDIHVFDLHTGERRLALEKVRWVYDASPDGTHLLYYRDGHFHTHNLATGEDHNITAGVPTRFIDTENDQNVVDPPTRPVGWSHTGEYVLISDNWDIWRLGVRGGEAVNLTGDGRTEQIRYRRRFQFDPDEEGIDLARPLYVNAYGEWTKKAGLARIQPGQTGAERLRWDDAAFNELIKAKDTDLYVYTRETVTEFPDFHATGPDLAGGRRLTTANPRQSKFMWSSGSRLLDYESKKGDRLQAALYLPAGYEVGQRYPTIVYIYEKLSQRLNHYPSPRVRGFDVAFYTSHGYAVLMPDITYVVNDPGLSAVWCVLPALQAAVDAGVTDPDHTAIHGHSWGGYQTAFLITQTDRFAAAVAGAALTNMISMYSSIYWNTGGANMAIFEASQGRFRGGYWDNIDAYTRNSPVYYAANVHTPLLLLHNDKDGAVDWNQGIEYYNTLRRMNKPVVMLQYKGENHGLRQPENQKDYTVRMKEFFDHHLKGAPAPGWWMDGVSHLELKDHLKDRVRLLESTPDKNTSTTKAEKEQPTEEKK